MPFCETCARYWAPSAAKADGTCPGCGRALAAPRTITRPRPEAPPIPGAAADGERRRAPWHFKVLVVCLIIYLGYRLGQMISWLLH